MGKEGFIQVSGVIIEALPGTMFKVKITDEKYTKAHKEDYIITCHIAGKMRMNFIKILEGDTVTVEISPYDPSKGIIIFRNK